MFGLIIIWFAMSGSIFLPPFMAVVHRLWDLIRTTAFPRRGVYFLQLLFLGDAMQYFVL
jgi:hypothetical protein